MTTYEQMHMEQARDVEAPQSASASASASPHGHRHRFVTNDEDPDEIHDDPWLDFDEDVFGISTVAIIKDLHYFTKKQDWPVIVSRTIRIVTTVALMGLTIALQVFLLVKIKQFVTAKAVHDIRLSYDAFEGRLYGNHTYLTRNEHRRGTDTKFLHAERFQSLPEDIKSDVCQIPFSQQDFFAAVLFAWTSVMMTEFRSFRRWLNGVILNTKTEGAFIANMRECFHGSLTDLGHEKEVQIVQQMTYFVKAMLIIFIAVPRFAIDIRLLWLGCRWLTATADWSDLLLNACALEFVLRLKELVFHAFVSNRSRKDLEKTKMLSITHGQGNKLDMSLSQVFPSIGFLCATFGWVAFYICYYQTVLPDYQWDVRDICTLWLKKRFAV